VAPHLKIGEQRVDAGEFMRRGALGGRAAGGEHRGEQDIDVYVPAAERVSSDVHAHRLISFRRSRALASAAQVRVFGGLVPTVSGFGLYYPRRRQQPAALAALVETLDSTLAARDPAAGRRRS